MKHPAGSRKPHMSRQTLRTHGWRPRQELDELATTVEHSHTYTRRSEAMWVYRSWHQLDNVLMQIPRIGNESESSFIQRATSITGLPTAHSSTIIFFQSLERAGSHTTLHKTVVPADTTAPLSPPPPRRKSSAEPARWRRDSPPGPSNTKGIQASRQRYRSWNQSPCSRNLRR